MVFVLFRTLSVFFMNINSTWGYFFNPLFIHHHTNIFSMKLNCLPRTLYFCLPPRIVDAIIAVIAFEDVFDASVISNWYLYVYQWLFHDDREFPLKYTTWLPISNSSGKNTGTFVTFSKQPCWMAHACTCMLLRLISESFKAVSGWRLLFLSIWNISLLWKKIV